MRIRAQFFSVFAIGLSTASLHAVIPVGTYTDAQWSHDPIATGLAGGHTVDASNYNYDDEEWEHPVKASGWNYDGNPGATSGSFLHSGSSSDVGTYFAFADLVQTTLTADAQYWTINFSVAGDYAWVGDKSAPEDPVGLKGKYYVYFGQFGTGNHWAFEVNDGSSLSSSFSTNGVKLYEDATSAGETPPYGTGINVTKEDSEDEKNYKGYNNEISTNRLQARTLYDPGLGIYDVEVRYDFSGAGGSLPTEAILASLDYYYIGTAVSNPSSASDLFANDHFSSGGSDSAEFDTLRIEDPQNPTNNDNYIPEPRSSAFIFGVVALAFVARRRPRA